MEKGRWKKRLMLLAAAAVLIAGLALILRLRAAPAYVEDVSAERLEWAYRLLADSLNTGELKYTDYLMLQTEEAGSCRAEAFPEGGRDGAAFSSAGFDVPSYPGQVAVLRYNEAAVYRVFMDQGGIYTLAFDYASASSSCLDYTASVEINGAIQYQELKTIDFPLYWKDETDQILTDRYGDQIAPSQERIGGWREAKLYNNTYSSVLPLQICLRAGENTITVRNVSDDGLALGRMTVLPLPEKPMAYAEYAGQYASVPAADAGLTVINAIDYAEKNSAKIIYKSAATPDVRPYNAEYKLLNTLSWTEPGDEITYRFRVDRTGMYTLTFHYMNEKEEFNSYETILIDGETPFAELQAYAFPYTGSAWANETLSDAQGRPYRIYLTQGDHTITLKAETAPVSAAWRYGQLIAEHATVFSLEIKKMAGEDPDRYRTWKMTRYIPRIPDYLEAYDVLLQHIRFLLQHESDKGINGALLSYLDKADLFIRDMAEYPDEIALYTKSLSGDDNSVLVAVSKFTSSIMKMDFSLDAVYVNGTGALPPARASVWDRIKNAADTVYYSFASQKYSMKDAEEDTLTIWVNRSLQHADLMQKMADTEFTPKTGVKVKITVIPDANKLTLACAAGNTPDMALGLASYMPFDLASRGALYDIQQFPDFWEINNRFATGAMVPYVYNERVYAVPETLDFAAIIYRTDIFASLGLDVPDTWDDLRALLPVLQRYGMNFYHNVSYGRTGYKWFYQTTPLIFQNGGKLYNDEGTATAIDSAESVRGIKELGDLFVAYSLDIQVNEFFNSFRYSVLPIGIVDANSYNLILNGAPELDGQWALAPYLGTPQENGEIVRWYVAASTGGVIFKDTRHAEAAWEFLKWWTSTPVQVEYTYALRSTYGDVYFWLPSNLDALRQAPIAQEDKQVILDMVPWIRDVPRTPGQYLLERSLSDIWNAMVNDGKSAQVAADEKVIEINREIRRKMQEFGYYDQDGRQIRDYVIRDYDWIQRQKDLAAEKGR
ncbi:MAG: extracellular solute-binding protein [Clostridiales bacterium]|nr:extracellular solute-binding protein [Clostridiales bacterium]